MIDRMDREVINSDKESENAEKLCTLADIEQQTVFINDYGGEGGGTFKRISVNASCKRFTKNRRYSQLHH